MLEALALFLAAFLFGLLVFGLVKFGTFLTATQQKQEKKAELKMKLMEERAKLELEAERRKAEAVMEAETPRPERPVQIVVDAGAKDANRLIMAQIKCMQCGATIEPGAKVCAHCGAKIPDVIVNN